MTKQRPLALVTGGVRRLGAVIASELARQGYDLALSSHGEPEPENELADILRANKTEWQCFSADLNDKAAPEKLIADVQAHFGRAPNLLVNNAAIFGQDQWQNMSAQTLDEHFQVNFFAPILLSQALVKASEGISNEMPDQKLAVIHILDQRISNPHGDQLSYTLSKQALAASVRSMAVALSGKARVNGVAPGLVISTEDYNAELEGRLADMMPLGKLPEAQSVARAVAYLAGANDTTGQVIFTDAGAHLKSFDRDFMHL